MNSIELRAYAKINLGLDILRKREDGYHDVKMIMQTVSLYDTLSIHIVEKKLTDNNGISLTCNLSYLPINENNLVYKSAKLMKDTYNITTPLHIHLNKTIPIAAGLAGGSSDAAAILRGMNELFDLQLSQDTLMKLGVRLGADIPYCILQGTALSEGIGEKLTPLKNFPSCYVLLVKPPINVSTKYVYENLKLDDTVIHPDINKIIESIHDNNLIAACKEFHNVLETVTIKEYPIIDQIKKDLLSLGSLTSLMSGSGPTVFGLFDSLSLAQKAYTAMQTKQISKQIYLVDLYQP